MIKYSQLALITACTLLTGCVNQNTLAQKELKPVTNPCQKIDLLLKSYHNNFDGVKMTQVKSKSTRIWKAKYNLVGENCQIWTLGNAKLTYSCRVDAASKAQAENYYADAKKTTTQCLDENWKSSEQPRNNDAGTKIVFSNPSEEATISAHIVPSKTVFGEEWTVYYYIGASK